MSIADKILLKKRALIETVNDELKNIAQIEHSRHRSFNNFIANSLSAIAAYCFFERKPAIDVRFINDGQLTIFSTFQVFLHKSHILLFPWGEERVFPERFSMTLLEVSQGVLSILGLN